MADISNTETRPERSLAVDIATVLTLAPVAAAGLRVWIYSGGDLAVFNVLIRTLDIPALLVSTAFQILPLIVWALIFYSLIEWRFRDWLENLLRNNRWLDVAAPLIFLLIIFTAPAKTVGLSVLFFVGAFVGYRIIYSKAPRARSILAALVPRRGDRIVGRGVADAASIAFFMALTFFASPGTMWLPLERVNIKDAPPLVGYVLESSEMWTTTLSRDYRILIISTSSVQSRTICREEREFRFIDIVSRADHGDTVAPVCNS